jgi:predicted membrane protein
VYLDFFTTKSSYLLIVDFAEELTLSVDLFHGSRSVASYFVFKVRTHSLRQYAHFLFVSSIGAAISYGIGTLCDHLEITSIAAPLLTAAVVAPVSYVLQRWVFWRKCPPTP